MAEQGELQYRIINGVQLRAVGRTVQAEIQDLGQTLFFIPALARLRDQLCEETWLRRETCGAKYGTR